MSTKTTMTITITNAEGVVEDHYVIPQDALSDMANTHWNETLSGSGGLAMDEIVEMIQDAAAHVLREASSAVS